MKKIFSLVLVLILVCGMLVSCGDPVAMIAKADAALEKAPYSTTMKINFEADNKELNDILSLMNMEIPMTVDGKNIAMNMSVDMMGYVIDADMVVVDKVLYYDIGMIDDRVKIKAEMNEEQYADFMKENNAQITVDPMDFSKLTVEDKDGKKYISGGEIGEDGLEKLNEMMESSLEGIDGKATVSNVTYGVTLDKKGRYEAIDMTCVYNITAADITSEVTFNMVAEFSYDNVASVEIPADADEYEEVSFDELLS